MQSSSDQQRQRHSQLPAALPVAEVGSNDYAGRVRARTSEAPPTAKTSQVLDDVTTDNYTLYIIAGVALVSLILALLTFWLFQKRRRMKHQSLQPTELGPGPSPPILVHPAQDFNFPQFVTREINFSLPSVRSCSLSSLTPEAMTPRASSPDCTAGNLSPPTQTQPRSNSFVNTADLGMLDPSLYKADRLDEDMLWPEGHVGRLWFSVRYEACTERLLVHLVKARHLPSRTVASANACDPFVRLQLMPDERRVLQSKQKKKTCNPYYDEDFVFQVPARNVENMILKLTLVDGGRPKSSSQLGHTIMTFKDLPPAPPDADPHMFKIDLKKELVEVKSDLGELLVSLLYNEHMHRLTVTIVEGRMLKVPGDKVCVCVSAHRRGRNHRRRRTSAAPLGPHGAALLAERFHFRLPAADLQQAALKIEAVQPATNKNKEKVFGQVVIGSYMFARGRALQHWNSAMQSPMESIQQWHSLSE